MPEAELRKVESANKALDRSYRIVRSHIVFNPGRKKTGLVPTLADLECAIRHEQNRTSTSKNRHSCPASTGKSILIFRSKSQPLNSKIFRSTRRANHFYNSARLTRQRD